MNAHFYQAHETFEVVYPKAPFSDLIRLGLALARGLVKLRERLAGPTMPAGIGHAAR